MLEPGKKYYVSPYPSMMIAFTMGKARFITKGFNIIAAHTDNPALRIKPEPEVVEEGMLTLNVEKYGGPILNTWFDRPLFNCRTRSSKKRRDFKTKHTACGLKASDYDLA